MSPLDYAKAIEVIQKTAGEQSPLSKETLGVAAALGRVTAVPLVSGVTVPLFDNSSVDGFAVRASDTTGASEVSPLSFSIAGSVVAGDVPPIAKPGEAWEIMTGAPFPSGLDASVKIEDVPVVRDARGKATRFFLKAPLGANENLRPRGEDFSPGQIIVKPGTVLGPEHTLALAALGQSEVSVYRRLKIAILGTGRELAASGAPLAPGQIRDATGPYLKTLLPLLGLETRHYGTVGDSPQDCRSAIERIRKERPDLILTTGAVSMGIHDFIRAIVSELGAEILFHKVAIRPGKPILFARFPEGTAFFGLPGNPISTVVGARFFLEPYVKALTGRAPERPAWARITHSFRKPEGTRCFFKARVTLGPEGASLTVLSGQPSFMIRPLVDTTAWAVFPEAGTQVAEGTWIECYPLYSSPYPWNEEGLSQ